MVRITRYAMNVLSVLLLVGVPVVQYFEERKLGMVRWLNYHNAAIREAVPFDAIKYAVLVCVIVALVLLLLQVFKRKEPLRISDCLGVALALISVVALTVAACVLTHEITHADFLIVSMTALAAILQVASLWLLVREMRERPLR